MMSMDSETVTLYREIDALGGAPGGDPLDAAFCDAIDCVLEILTKRGFTEEADVSVVSPVKHNALRDAANDLLNRMFSTYKARNGRDVGIQGEDGEKCWIVHSDDIEALRQALTKTDDTASLPNGLRYQDGELQFQCRVCEYWTEWPDDVAAYDPDAHENVCGGSPRCIP